MANGIGLIGMIGATKGSSAWDGSGCWTSCGERGTWEPSSDAYRFIDRERLGALLYASKQNMSGLEGRGPRAPSKVPAEEPGEQTIPTKRNKRSSNGGRCG